MTEGRRLLPAPPWPYFTAEQAALSRAAWELPPTVAAGCGAATAQHHIPNEVHQPWLHGGALKWEHVLGMLSVRHVLRPELYTLYYDKQPAASATWRCACAIADCVKHAAPTRVPGTKQRLKMYHYVRRTRST